jgi:hypothetical protein
MIKIQFIKMQNNWIYIYLFIFTVKIYSSTSKLWVMKKESIEQYFFKWNNNFR